MMGIKKFKKDKIKLAPPAVAFFNRLKAFMECDPEVKLVLDEDSNTINIAVDNAIKAAAWRQILPRNKMIGSIEVNINISSTKTGVDAEIIRTALSGNTAFSKLEHVIIPDMWIDRYYCYLNPTVLQFFNDNFASPESLETRLAEDIAKDVLDIPELSYCTEPIKQ